MFRQLLRPSLRSVSRSSSSRPQHAARAYHKHFYTGRRPPRPSPYKICLYVPIQTCPALLQLGQSCHSTSCKPSYFSSHSFHTTRRVQGPFVPFISILAALKVRPSAATSCPMNQFHTPFPLSRLQCLRSSAQLVVSRLRSFPFFW